MFTIRAGLLVVSFVALVPGARGAEERLSRPDVAAIEQVVRDQLDAFVHDDAGRAWGHASPEIQRRFRTPDEFMRMVRDHYRAVYRPGNVHFVDLKRVDGTWTQTVDVVDEGGAVWRAAFQMKRQGKGGWKVAGCTLTGTSSIAT